MSIRYNILVLSSAVLQLIALITMTIDHVGFFMLDNNRVMRAIGRIAFPLFAFMIAEGMRHTRSFKKYFFRVFVSALATQVPFTLLLNRFHISFELSILAGFCLSMLAIQGWKRSGIWRFAIVPMLIISLFIPMDYKLVSVFLPFAFYFILENIKGLPKYAFEFFALSIAVIAIMVITSSTLPVFTFLAIIPIWLYSGKRGRRLPAIISYGFYPIHFLAIYLILLALH